MRQREIEGLYSPTPESSKESTNYQMVGEGHVTIFNSGGTEQFTPRQTNLATGMNAPDATMTPESVVSHFKSLQRVEELNESVENLNSARSSSKHTAIVIRDNMNLQNSSAKTLSTPAGVDLNTREMHY